MYKHIFGPVPSRRLGISLGVDLVPRKVCSLDCVYCEVGKTTCLTTTRKEYVSFEKIKDELLEYFDENNHDPEYITFSGSGEPTLNNRIDDVIALIRNIRPKIPIAVLTNGTLLHDNAVRSALLQTDCVLPSLDAATTESFIKINRPDKSLSLEKYIDGLISFRKEFTGKIFLEIFILPEYNDSDNDIHELRKAVFKIQPDAVQLNTLDRPGVVKNLRAATHAELRNIVKMLDMPNVNIVAPAPQRKKIQSYRKDAENALIETISRRPCTLDDLAKILGLHINEINKYLDVLEAENIIEAVSQKRGLFYQLRNK